MVNCSSMIGYLKKVGCSDMIISLFNNTVNGNKVNNGVIRDEVFR